MRQPVQHRITGSIRPHRGRGRQLGVPTLNLVAPAKLPDGIYAGFVLHNNQRCPAAIFVGAAITFGETERQVEAHLLDASVDMVGEITVECTHFIRLNQQFAQAEQLQQQMLQDIAEIKLCLQESSGN